MAMTKTEIQARYDSKNTVRFTMKLNTTTDADVISKLRSESSMQGYIKQLIRADLAKEKGENSMNNWDYIVSLMDDEIRESVHADLSPCSENEFLEEYKTRHFKKYGQEFVF